MTRFTAQSPNCPFPAGDPGPAAHSRKILCSLSCNLFVLKMSSGTTAGNGTGPVAQGVGKEQVSHIT